MNIVIVTDAWYPQINGVVRTITLTCEELVRLGHTVEVIGPDAFRTIPCPTYPEIRLSLFPGARLRARLGALQPDAVHISTEGPLGFAARAWCLKKGFPFTTSFHTQFPEYVKLRTGIPLALSYRFMRWFHGPAATVMVATRTLHERLTKWGFRNLGMWSRGVDTSLFRPRTERFLKEPRPVFMYLGRVAVEKKHRGVPGARLARHQVCRWRRSGPGNAETQISGGALPLASRPARSWRVTSPARMCSCFRAAPTPSGWC